MSVPDSEISPPETDDYVNCGGCRVLTFVDDLTDGICGKCYCSECEGEGCLACEPEYVEIDILLVREIKDAFTEYSIAGCIDEAHSVAKYPALRDAILKLPEVS